MIGSLSDPILIDWSVPKQVVNSSGMVTNPSSPDVAIVDDGVDSVEINYNLARLLGATCIKNKELDKNTKARKNLEVLTD